MAAPDPAPIRLTAGRARSRENDLLAEAAGGRVGIAGVLAALTRRATPVDTRGTAARRGFAWDREDQRSHWWPQGVTSSADSGLPEERPLLVTTSYAKEVGDVAMGSRITVVDLDSAAYAHVLLVWPEVDDAGQLEVRPVRSHAGGIAWRGNQLHVGSTARGVYTFDLGDIAAARTDRPHELGVLRDGGVAAYAHRFVLPARRLLKAGTAEGATPFRYSFLSVSHEQTPRLWVGEYGRDGATTRLATYTLAEDGQVATGEDGVAVPAYLSDGGVPRMQGVAEVDGVLHATTSNGRRGRGSLWVGTPGRLRQHEKVLPPGPEDLCYRPAEDELWTVTEYPRRRTVLGLRRSDFLSP